MCLLVKKVNLFTCEDKCICSCINVHIVRVITSEEILFRCEDKCICLFINVHVFTSQKGLFTCEDQSFNHSS